MTQSAASVSYTLRFPGSWWHLDLDPSTRDASIRRRVEQQTKDAPHLTREQVDGLIRSTRRIARDAHAQGALEASGMLRVLSPEVVLSATTAVVRITVPEGESEDLGDLVLSAARQLDTDAQRTGLPRGEVELLELPHAGPAGRLTRTEDVDHRGTPVRTAMRHTLVPVPGGRDYLVLASSTPCVDLAEHFYEVFDAIAESLRFEGASAAA